MAALKNRAFLSGLGTFLLHDPKQRASSSALTQVEVADHLKAAKPAPLVERGSRVLEAARPT